MNTNTTTYTSINLRTQEILSTTNLSDPVEIATRILAEMDPADYESALRECIPPMVRISLAASRSLVLNPPSGRIPSSPISPISRDTGGGVFRPVHSPKLAAIAENAWQRRLEQSLCVNGTYKRLRECTKDDLLDVALSLKSQAEASLTKASYYEKLAAAVPEGQTLGVLKADPTEASE